MKFVSCFLVAFLLVMSSLTAISQIAEEDSLMAYTEELMMSDDLTIRQNRFEEVVSMLTALLQEQGLFHYPFEKLERTSIIYAPDSTFRIFTGQLFLDDDHFKYYGVLQHRSNPHAPIVLEDWAELVERPNEEILGSDNWLGALYYGIKDFKRGGKTYYVVFGYNGYELYEDLKVADVISFDAEGKPTFGAPVFQNHEGEYWNRLVLKYAADVTVRLNFDQDLDLIAFDNLIPMKSPYKQKQVLMVPDGSYSGYHLDLEGNWIYVDKLFHQISDVAPRAVPVLGQDNRDLFGRQKN